MPQPSRILVVDDAETIRHLMRHTLGQAGYYVKTASHGTEALETARQQRFDMVFTDIHMPGMDGISLIKALRAMSGYEHTPILALTMTNTDIIKSSGKAAGATGWVSKPVSPPQLLELLKNFGLTATHRNPLYA